MEIAGFFGEYRFLSNFYHFPVYLDGYWWPTNEHYFQWKKADILERYWAKEILSKPDPKWAKHIGWKIQVRKDWDDYRLEVMENVVWHKFAQYPLTTKLLDTYPFILVEENNWNDTYWGRCRGRGTNHLGRILMYTRECLRCVTVYQ